MAGLPKRLLLLPLVLLALLLLFAPADACPFCNMTGPTLTGEVVQAKLVLYGDLTNAKESPNGDGTTDLVVKNVIKNDLAGKKDDPLAGRTTTVRLDRYLVPVPNYHYLVYCDVFRGKNDPYRTVPVKDGDIAKYVIGALEHKDEKIGKRLRYFFDYLDNADLEISNDAYKEFGNADYNDYKDMAKSLPADRVAGWLGNERTPSYRFGLYASMLGHCGTARHADLLRRLLDDPAKRLGSGVDGMLAGYVMLKPRDGWAYTRDILKDGKKEFMFRYAALRAVRFLWDSRPDLVERKELTAGIGLLLEQSDIADLAIDDLRKRQCWDLADKVLGLQSSKAFEIPIVRRAVLRYCLACQDSMAKGRAAAKAYVDGLRKKDPQMVADAEELLKLEQMPPATPGSRPTTASK